MRKTRLGCVEETSTGYKLTELGLANVRELAAIGAKVREIASYLRTSTQWVRNCLDPESPFFDAEVDEAYSEGQHEFRRRILEAQANLADTNAQMAIHLGKHHLDQREDPVEHNHTIRVVGTLPDYASTPAEWAKQFAPTPLQVAAEVKRADVIDLVPEKD